MQKILIYRAEALSLHEQPIGRLALLRHGALNTDRCILYPMQETAITENSGDQIDSFLGPINQSLLLKSWKVPNAIKNKISSDGIPYYNHHIDGQEVGIAGA